MKHKLYTRLLSLALAVGLVIGMLPCAAAVDTVGDGAGQPVTLGNGDQVSFTLPVKLYGDDGTDLSSAKTVNIPIVDGQTVQLPGEYTQGIESISSGDKTYSYDYVAAGFNGDRIDQLQAGIVSSKTNDNVLETHYDFGHTWREVKRTVTVTYGVWFGSKPSNASGAIAYKTQDETYTLTQTYWAFRGWEDDEGSVSDSTFSPASEQNNNKNIYFMYSKDGTLVPDKELTRDKIVTLKDDGTYDLTLTVSGAAGSITNPQKLDVVFIVDKSGSMAWDMNHDDSSDDSSWEYQDPDADDTPRLTAVKNAIRQIASELDSSETIDARYSLVSFSGSISGWDEDYYTYNDATVNQTWTDNLNTFTNQLNRISADGGTNYEAGLYSANQELLDSTRPGAMTAVIFLSDGEPTYYYDRDGYTTGSGSSYSQQAMDDAKAEAAKMAVDFFYAIGVGDSYNEQTNRYADTLMPAYMQDLVSGATQAKSTQFFDGNNSDALNNIFDQIGGNITSILCSNVTVRDTLSKNVEIVTGGSGSGTPTSNDFTITVVGEDGQTVATDKGSVQVDGATIIASYNQESRQIVLDFPDDYQLKKGYTYKVSTTIQATEAAYEAYRNSGNSYPNTGDQGTGTHAGKDGLYTNNKATVDYTYNGKNYSAEYPKPVIQLNPGTLTITKQITGDLTEEQLAALEKSIKFDVVLNEASTSYPLSGFTKSDDNFYTMSIRGLSPDTKYTVTETGAELPGYILTQTPDDGKKTGTVAKGGTATAAFTNDYKVATRDISVTKVWEGSKTHPESVTVWLYADRVKTDEYVTLNAANDWKAFFTGLDIYNKEGKEIVYTVQEDTVNGYTGVVTGDMTAGFTITNTRDTGSLTIEKTVKGLDDTALTELKNEISFEVKDSTGKVIQTISKTSENWDAAWSGSNFTYTINDLPTGSYTVTESGYDDITNYIWQQSGSITTATGTVVYKDAGTSAALKNVYTPADGYLKIVKDIINGTPFGDGRDTFNFKVTALEGTKDAGKVWYFTIEGEGNTGSIKLPVGQYKVEELSNINYTCNGNSVKTVTVSNNDTEISPETVTFTNTPDKTNIPTDGDGVKNVPVQNSDGSITWKQENYDDIVSQPTTEPTPKQ